MITVPCNLCGRDDYRVRFPATTEPDALRVDAFRCTHAGYGHHPQIVECRHCGLVYANPRWPTDTVLEAYTSVEDETYVEERHGRELTFRHHLRRIERIVGPAAGRALLDVGAYIGVFVEVAAAAGWRAQLAAHGVAIEMEIDRHPGGLSLYFRDPAGNSIELAPPTLWGCGRAG